MRTVSENTTSKTAQTSSFYVNGHSLASLKSNWFLKIRFVDLQYLMFNSNLEYNNKPITSFQDT